MTPTPDLKAAALAAMLLRLKRLAEKASPGIWKVFNSVRTRTFAVHTPDDETKGNIVGWMGFDGTGLDNRQNSANAKFIAAANPATILALLERLQVAEDAAKQVAIKDEIIEKLLAHCADPECYTCGHIICPHGESLHFHHDGCPACDGIASRRPA